MLTVAEGGIKFAKILLTSYVNAPFGFDRPTFLDAVRRERS